MAALHALAALIVFFFPGELFYLVNVGPKVFKITEAIPDSSEKLWLAYATAAMAMFAALSLLASGEPKVRGYSLIWILGKVVAGCALLWLFLNQGHYFAYLAFSILELLLAALTAIFMVRKGAA